MKKRLLKLFVLFSLIITAIALAAACNSKQSYPEIAGTYKISGISGTWDGYSVGLKDYEYFNVVLSEDGNATVEYKGAGTNNVAESYSGTYTYDSETGDLVISYGFACLSVKEEMTLSDDVITYHLNEGTMNVTVKFTKS